MTRSRKQSAVLVAACIAVLLALPATAGAVLSGENGRIVFVRGPDAGGDAQAQIHLLPVPSSTGGGTVSQPVTSAAVQHRHPTWSPDRTKIAYAAGSASCNPNKCDIFVLDLTTPGATPENITNSPTVNEDRPAWSPDGTRIAYESEVTNGSSQLDILVDTDPFGVGGTLNLTDSSGVIDGKPAWSPNSQTLYYAVGNVNVAPNGNTNDVKIFQEPASNTGTATELIHVSGAHSFQPSISPDGTKACFTLSTTAGLNTSASILVGPLSSPASSTVLASSGAGDYNCTWSPDGAFVAYVTGTFSSGQLVMERSDNSSIPIDLAQDPGANNFDGNPDWAPDGRPDCPDSTATTNVNVPVTIPVACTDTGPAYEQTEVREFLTGNPPTNGTATQNLAGDPITYTPNSGFVGTDSFQIGSFDELGFGTDRGTVTINVVTPSQAPGADATRPNVTGVSVSPRTWRRGSRLPRFSRARVGTRIRWRLSEDARATLTFQRALPGRRVGSRCLRPTRARRGRARCTRFRNAGSLTRANAKAGLNTLRFQGRLTRTRRLALGRYRLSVVARDAAGNRSLTRRSRTFRIVRR